jgi:hypothetical protein
MSSIKLTFSVYGENFSPTEFSNVIGRPSTKQWSKNDPIPDRNNMFRKETAWDIVFQSNDLNEDIEHLCNRLKKDLNQNFNKVKEYIERHKLCTKVFIYVLFGFESAPAVFFDAELIRLLAMLNGEIDVDIYFSEEPMQIMN